MDNQRKEGVVMIRQPVFVKLLSCFNLHQIEYVFFSDYRVLAFNAIVVEDALYEG